jgi:cytochrome c oxidase cbb3-type subunit 4
VIVMSYDTFARIAQQGGTIYFFVIFVAGCLYALWPRKKADFQEAARIPLEDDQ